MNRHTTTHDMSERSQRICFVALIIGMGVGAYVSADQKTATPLQSSSANAEQPMRETSAATTNAQPAISATSHRRSRWF